MSDETEKENSEDNEKAESKEKNNSEENEEESELEEIIEENKDEMNEEQFQEFISQNQFQNSSPSLEKLNSSQENIWSRRESSNFEDDNRDQIKYSSAQGTDLKYTHENISQPKKIDLNQFQKTPNQLIEEQKEIHKRTFMQDPMLQSTKNKHDYEPAPEDFFEKKEFQNIRDDYKI